MRITVRVTPKSSTDEVSGWKGDQLLVRVTAAPENGKANAAVERTVAMALGIPKSAVRVVRGHTSRTKILEVDGVDEYRVTERFGPHDARLW